jgi:hypothetical protein
MSKLTDMWDEMEALDACEAKINLLRALLERAKALIELEWNDGELVGEIDTILEETK